MLKRKPVLSLLLVMALVVIACATFVRNSYRTLATAGETYDATMQSIGKLYSQGNITDADKDKIVTLAKAFKQSYDIAVDSLEAYKRTEDAAEREKFIKAVEFFTPVLQELVSLVNELSQKNKEK